MGDCLGGYPLMDEKTNDLIHGIYQLIDSVPVNRFKGAAFDLVAQSIPLEAGLWAEGHMKVPPVVHGLYLHNLPAELMESYARYSDKDVLYQAISSNPNRSIRMSDLVTREEIEASELYQRHSRFFGIEWIIATAKVQPDLGLYSVIAFYRSFCQPDFSDAEKALKELMMPHLISAYRIKLFQASLAGEVAGERYEAAAIIDLHGIIHHASSGLSQLLRQFWPEWKGPALPLEVREHIHAGRQAFFIESLYFSLSNLRNQMLFLKCRDLDCLNELSASESKVAFLLSQGWSYKEVSKGLGISPSTVTNHVNHIYKKLKICSKSELRKIFTEFERYE